MNTTIFSNPIKPYIHVRMQLDRALVISLTYFLMEF